MFFVAVLTFFGTSSMSSAVGEAGSSALRTLMVLPTWLMTGSIVWSEVAVAGGIAFLLICVVAAKRVPVRAAMTVHRGPHRRRLRRTRAQ